MAVLVLLVLVALIVLAVRLSKRGAGPGQLSAHVVRSALTYVLLLAGLVVTAIGLAGLLGQLLGQFGVGGTVLAGGSAEAARNAALVTVGLPVVAALGVMQRRALRSFPEERDRPGWTLCVTVASLLSLLVAMTSAQICLDWLFGTEPADPWALGRFVVWSLVWGLVWWIDRAITPAARRQPHLLVGSLLGLVYVAVGLANLLGGTAALLLGLQRETLTDRAAPALAGLAAFAVGVPVWLLYWWRTARGGPRSRAWLSYLVLTGMGGAVAALVGAVVAVDDVLVWFLGSPAVSRAEVHFRSTPYAVATAAVGVLVLRYHDQLLRTAVDRRDAVLQVRAYLLSAIGLVAAAVGAGVLVTAVVDAATRGTAVVSHPADTALLAVALLVIALPLWASTWWSVQRFCRADPEGDRAATSRRLYLAGLTGIGSLAALGALVTAVYLLFEDLFAGSLGLATLRGMRFALGVLVPATLVAGYHAVLLRAERGAVQGGQHRHPRSVVLVGPRDAHLASQVSRVIGASVDSWPRTDVEEPAWSVADVAALVGAYPGQDVLVVSGPDGLRALPVQRRGPHAAPVEDRPVTPLEESPRTVIEEAPRTVIEEAQTSPITDGGRSGMQ